MARKHTVLVVDDEPDVVQSVKDLLRLDFKVVGATRALDGIKILQDQEVHVVMSDQRMPGMTGVEFLQKVRGDYPEAIRLLFTGYADIRAVIDAINEGNVYRYIVKPWDPDELISIIRQACEKFDLLVERTALMGELQRKNAELEAANAELHRANEMKSGFIRVASHELRSPLTILNALSEIALRKPATQEQLRDYVVRIDKSGARLKNVVEQLTTMLALNDFERKLARKPTELAPLLREAADDVAPFVALRHQKLALDLPEAVGTLDVDAAKVKDAVSHILVNAIKFTPDEGTITVAARRTDDGGAQIRVTDTGIGMDAETVTRVFQPFFTEIDVTHHSSGSFEFQRRGMGLGLTVARAFIEMHQGNIAVTSEPGRGSTFTITLPRVTHDAG